MTRFRITLEDIGAATGWTVLAVVMVFMMAVFP